MQPFEANLRSCDYFLDLPGLCGTMWIKEEKELAL